MAGKVKLTITVKVVCASEADARAIGGIITNRTENSVWSIQRDSNKAWEYTIEEDLEPL